MDVRVARESKTHWWRPTQYVVILSGEHVHEHLSVPNGRAAAESVAREAREAIGQGKRPDLAALLMDLTAW